jgi:hypothetical protein
MIKFFLLAILASLIFKALYIREVSPTASEQQPTPRIRALGLLVFTPFKNCQDKKT